MRRRTFLRTSVATLGTAAAGSTVQAAEPSSGEVYELRSYSVKEARRAVMDQYLSQAFIPAAKRAGSGPIGVFAPSAAMENPKLWVLIVHPSANDAATLTTRLMADPAYLAAGKEYLDARAADPVYARVESSLLVPITGMPKIAKTDSGKPRLLNLRIYESHNERAVRKKIEMFNVAELSIFRRTGLTPVFFAEAVIGSAMPNLTYMLVFPDDASRNAAWAKFRDDAEWKELKAKPEYLDKEIVSKITNHILIPTAYSEI